MMNLLESETALLDKVHALSGEILVGVRGFVDDPGVRTMAANYAANAGRRKVDLGFNPFALVSDVYHRENFHSDILAAVLDPQGAHGQGDRFLRLFLEFLRDRHHLAIDPEDYRNASVVRESARIDVLIWDDVSGKALIMENKINGAADMERQVVRYLKEVVDVRRLTCDAIVYLTLLQKKVPDLTGWESQEIERVDPLLLPVCAYEESGRDDDLYQGWLKACADKCPEPDAAFVINQYRQILLKLGQNAMNTPLMEAFYDLMKDPERHKTALSVTSMVNDLPAFRCQRLMDRFRGKHSPFLKIYQWGTLDLVFHGLAIERGTDIKIDVVTESHNLTCVSFWDNADVTAEIPKKVLSEIGFAERFTDEFAGRPAKNFAFPGEDEALVTFLRDFLQALKSYVNPSLPASTKD